MKHIHTMVLLICKYLSREALLFTLLFFLLILRLAYNVGFHNEHHDFPRIPGSRLPLVRKIAPEFYDDLPQVSSWPGTIYNFIVFPHMSPWSRYRRPLKSKSD